MGTVTNDFTFFARPPKKEQVLPVNLVSGPSVYAGLAIACCDQVSRLSLNPEPRKLAPLMRAYFDLYPETIPQGLNTPVGQLLQLMKTYSSDVFIPRLAEAFQRVTLRGLEENPTLYHEYALPPQTSDWMSICAPQVISELLGITVRLKITASGKPLHAMNVYSTESHLALELRVRHGHYSVSVNDKTYFGDHERRGLSHHFNFELPQLSTLKVENEIVLKKFKETYTRLLTMVQAYELTKDRLLEVYLGISHRLHATQAYFDSINWDHEGHDQHLIHELIHALSRLIALGDLDENLLFNRIEAVPELTIAPTLG